MTRCYGKNRLIVKRLLSAWCAATVMVVCLPAQADDRWIQAGEVLSYTLPLTAAIATFTLDDPEGRSQLLLAYGLTMTSAYLLQGFAERKRPDGSDEQSFPSLSGASSFLSAAFLQRRYGWDVGIPAYLAASYVGWSTVYSDRHYASDVVAGAALALGVNLLLVEPGSASQFALAPTAGGMALAFEINF
jgi:hypothetical protein